MQYASPLYVGYGGHPRTLGFEFENFEAVFIFPSSVDLGLFWHRMERSIVEMIALVRNLKSASKFFLPRLVFNVVQPTIYGPYQLEP